MGILVNFCQVHQHHRHGPCSCRWVSGLWSCFVLIQNVVGGKRKIGTAVRVLYIMHDVLHCCDVRPTYDVVEEVDVDKR